MKLGIGSYTYPWSVGVAGRAMPEPMGAFCLMDRAREHQVQAVQYCDNLPLTTLSEPDLDRLVEMSGEIAIEVGTRGLDPEEFARCAHVAARVGSPFVRLVTTGGTAGLVSQLRGFLEILDGRMLAIENHDSTPAAELRQIVEELGPDGVGICLDTANSLGALEGLDTVIRELGPHVVNLHVKDVQIRRTWHQMGFEVTGTPAGSGMVPIPEILHRLAEYGFDGSVILEHWPAPLDDDAQLRTLEGEWTRQSLAYLRGVMR